MHETFLGDATASTPVTITLGFRPRNAAELKTLAERPTGRHGLSTAALRMLFTPSATVTGAADAYLRRFGFRMTAAGILTRSYTGTVLDSENAFQTTIARYQAGKVRFQRPDSPVTLPPQLATAVEGVSGLDTYPVYHPASVTSKASAVTASCSGPWNVQAYFGTGYQPSQLAASTGYNYQSLLDAGANGHGDVLALLEFSTYSPSETATYQSCYGTSVPNTNVLVNGGTTDTTGSGEVELDQEVAATAAPGLSHMYTYIAPNGYMYPVIDQMLNDRPTTGTTEISISWGGCELYGSGWNEVMTDQELQLAAAAGVSVFAASGDHGATDCYPSTTYPDVDYPASSPYITGVGGTTLYSSGWETAWGTPTTQSGGGGGGGTSFLYTMPSWQSGPGVISAYSDPSCGGYCREVPDVALDANPDTGYVVRLDGQWTLEGGTSAAAPLLAAITADANSYSLAYGGNRVGFANPFFYQHAGYPLLNDVSYGSNSMFGRTTYPATSGYDMATGLGSPNALVYAQKLLGLTDKTPPAVTLAAPSAGFVTTSTPTFSGAAGAATGDASSVSVSIYSGTSTSGTLVRTLSAPIGGSGWTITPGSAIADGTYTAQAVQTDAAANVGNSGTVTFTIDTVTPTVTITSPGAGSSVRANQPVIGGSAGSQINDSATVNATIYAGSDTTGAVVATLPATRSGASWSLAPGSPLAEGTYTAQATQADAAGHVGHSAPVTFTVDTIAPTVTLDTPAAGWVTTSTPVLSGAASSAPGDASSVTVRLHTGASVGGAVVRTFSAPIGGSGWTITPGSAIADGTYTAQAVQTDAAANVGNSGTVTFTIDTVTPTVTITSPGAGSSVRANQPVIGGSAGSQINDSATVNATIYAGSDTTGAVVATLPATRSGASWSLAPGSPLAEGTYTAQATQADAAGHVGHSAPVTFTVDTIAPTVTLDTPAAGWVTTSTPVLSGAASSAPGDASSVTVRLHTGASVGGAVVRTFSAPIGGSGWTITPGSAIADGTYTAQAVQTDAAANVGNSGTVTFTIDTVTPTVTVSAPLAGIYTQNTQPTFTGSASNDTWDATLVTVNVYQGTSTSRPRSRDPAADAQRNELVDHTKRATCRWYLHCPGQPERRRRPCRTERASHLHRGVLPRHPQPDRELKATHADGRLLGGAARRADRPDKRAAAGRSGCPHHRFVHLPRHLPRGECLDVHELHRRVVEAHHHQPRQVALHLACPLPRQPRFGRTGDQRADAPRASQPDRRRRGDLEQAPLHGHSRPPFHFQGQRSAGHGRRTRDRRKTNVRRLASHNHARGNRFDRELLRETGVRAPGEGVAPLYLHRFGNQPVDVGGLASSAVRHQVASRAFSQRASRYRRRTCSTGAHDGAGRRGVPARSR